MIIFVVFPCGFSKFSSILCDFTNYLLFIFFRKNKTEKLKKKTAAMMTKMEMILMIMNEMLSNEFNMFKTTKYLITLEIYYQSGPKKVGKNVLWKLTMVSENPTVYFTFGPSINDVTHYGGGVPLLHKPI